MSSDRIAFPQESVAACIDRTPLHRLQPEGLLSRPPPRRPDGISYFALAETEAKLTTGAFGVKVDADKVTIAVAFVNPALAFDRVYEEQYTLASVVIQDYFGLGQTFECKWGQQCRRQGCSFYHGRRGEAKVRATNSRVLANNLRYADDKAGPGILDSKASHALVAKLEFSRNGDNVDWSVCLRQAVTCEAVIATSVWRDEDVLAQHRRALRQERIDFDSGTNATNLAILWSFAQYQMLPSSTPSQRAEFFTKLLASEHNVEMSNSPIFAVTPDGRIMLELSSRDLVSLRRLLIDVMCDVFNRSAVKTLSQSVGRYRVLARKIDLPADLANVVGPAVADESGVNLSRVTTVGLPMGFIVKALPQSIEEIDAATISRSSRPFYVKFNAPFREFVSFHNLLQLHCCVNNLVSPHPNADSDAINRALATRRAQEHQKFLAVAAARDSVIGAKAQHAGGAVVLVCEQYFIQPPNRDASAPFDIRPAAVSFQSLSSLR